MPGVRFITQGGATEGGVLEPQDSGRVGLSAAPLERQQHPSFFFSLSHAPSPPCCELCCLINPEPIPISPPPLPRPQANPRGWQTVARRPSPAHPCFCAICRLRRVFTFLSGLEKNEKKSDISWHMQIL